MELDAVKRLKMLVQIATVNPPGGEMPLLECLAGMLREGGIPCTIQETQPGRGNLVACLPAEKPDGQPPLFLISHIDVVPAEAQQWSHPPFAAEEENGYIYGRGTVDTKQLTVMELEAFLALKRSKAVTRRDVFFLATSDEEAGSRYGLQWFLDHEITLNGVTRTGREWFADSDVISEGGGFPIVANGREYYLCESGQKSCGTVEFIVKARKAKGSFFVSADGMTRAMGLVEDIGNTKLEGSVLETVRNFEQALGDAELSPMMRKILFAMRHNTLTATMITGKNVNEVHVTCDVRLIPGFSREWLRKLLDGFCEKWDCEANILSLSDGYEQQPGGRFLQILEEATLEGLGRTREEAQILPFISMGSSDGRFLTSTGAHVYGYSPVYSWDMTFDQAVTMVHGVNERIHRDSLTFGCRVLTRAVAMAAGEERRS